MDFKEISRMCALFVREYASDFLRLLAIYPSLSASEAASRLNLHIQTSQDFLEELHGLGIIQKTEVFENKRPYFRYRLVKKKLAFNLNLEELVADRNTDRERMMKICERKNAPVIFSPSSVEQRISSITLLEGRGRERVQRKIKLTESQGRFLYHLPFPTDLAQTIESMMKKAELAETSWMEILDIVGLLERQKAIEVHELLPKNWTGA